MASALVAAERTLRALPDWEVVTSAGLGIVTFRYAPPARTPAELDALNGQLVDAVIVVLIGGLLALAVWLVNLIFCILAAVQTSQGKRYQYPFTLRLIK